jgi:hypothetical protein
MLTQQCAANNQARIAADNSPLAAPLLQPGCCCAGAGRSGSFLQAGVGRQLLLLLLPLLPLGRWWRGCCCAGGCSFQSFLQAGVGQTLLLLLLRNLNHWRPGCCCADACSSRSFLQAGVGPQLLLLPLLLLGCW